jgi:large subunit ribosomal protein L21e
MLPSIAVGSAVNKQVMGKILAQRINVCIDHIKCSKSQRKILKRVKESDQKKKEANKKGILVQRNKAPTCPAVRTTGKEPRLPEPKS